MKRTSLTCLLLYYNRHLLTLFLCFSITKIFSYIPSSRGDDVRAILIGIIAALFFSVTFILNRSMELDGGSWAWSASLRFIFMLPLLLLIVGFQRNVKPLLTHIANKPTPSILSPTLAIGLFYSPLTAAPLYC